MSALYKLRQALTGSEFSEADELAAHRTSDTNSVTDNRDEESGGEKGASL